MSVSAYKRTVRDNASPRDIERSIFSRITAALAQHAATYDQATDSITRMALLQGSLQPALLENTRLWALLRTDLSHPDNALPPETRAGLISLSHAVDRQTTAILRGEGLVQGLLDINRPIIDGLAGIAPEGV